MKSSLISPETILMVMGKKKGVVEKATGAVYQFCVDKVNKYTRRLPNT